MASIRDLLKQKIDLIENSPERFIGRVNSVQDKLLKRALELLGELDTEGGAIIANERNLAKIQEITEILKNNLNKGEYLEAVKDLVSDMDKTKVLTDSYFTKVVDGFTQSEKLTEIYKVNRASAIESFIGQSTIESNFLQPIKDVLIEGITNEMNYSDLIKNISTIFIGDEKREGKLKKYASQIAGDAFSTTERNYTSMLADELDVQFIRYVGGLVADSRCFCEERNGKYFHIEEVRAWGDGDLSAGGLNTICDEGGGTWKGMYIGTNSGNIEQWLGGYNCKHSLAFVSAINVPDDVRQRAIEAGFYKP